MFLLKRDKNVAFLQLSRLAKPVFDWAYVDYRWVNRVSAATWVDNVILVWKIQRRESYSRVHPSAWVNLSDFATLFSVLKLCDSWPPEGETVPHLRRAVAFADPSMIFVIFSTSKVALWDKQETGVVEKNSAVTTYSEATGNPWWL